MAGVDNKPDVEAPPEIVEGMDVAAVKSKVLTDPAVLGAMSQKLNSLVGKPSNYVATLPMEVKKRLKALRKIQGDYLKLNGQFYKEAAELESKYFKEYNQLFDKRATIISGSYEPTEEECVYTEVNPTITEELETQVESETPATGIPSFWLTCMKNAHDGGNEIIIEEDEPILEHLTNITIDDSVDSFKILFHFSPNDYFSNDVLTKEFKLKLGPSDEDPFNFEGPEIIASKGCKIDWKTDKDVTRRKVSKKQKNKKTGTFRVVHKYVQTDSFFNFFNHHEAWLEENDDMDETELEAIQHDNSLGSFLRERLIPRAVLFFTGELSGYGAEDYDEEYDEECDDEDADSDADPDYKPTKKGLRKLQQQQQDCKQQ